jgi:alkylhydroperoxidase/carboxymuconolactone decarboxylase family protein YurZ
MLEAVNASSGRSGSTDNKWPNFILPGMYDSGFGLRLMLKDMRIAIELARQLGWKSVLGEAAVACWQQAAEDLPPGADHTRIAAWLRAQHEAPPTRRLPKRSEADSVMALTSRQTEVKDEFIRVRGTWGPAWESILRLDPEFLETYLNYSAVPLRKRHLEPKIQEFIYIAVDAAATHLYEPGVRAHVKAALDLGATAEEIMEVLELTSTLGVHALNIGAPVLVEVLDEEGLRPDRTPLTERQEQYKQEFIENRGYWHTFWDDLLELDPEIFKAYTDFSSVPWKNGTLEPKVKEFIYTAFDVAATHLYVPGLRERLRNALRYGATPQELLEVMEIASVIGIHGAMLGAPILTAELDARQAKSTA